MAQLEAPFKRTGRRGWQQRVRVRRPDGTWKRLQKGGFPTKDDARAWRDAMSGVAREQITLPELFDRYLAVHSGANSTRKNLRWKLDKALAAFGAIRPAALTREDVERWRLTIPDGHRSETTQALKQAIRWAAAAGLIESGHPILAVKNPQPTRGEIEAFKTWEQVEMLAEEFDPRFAAIPIFAAGTGLRPGEWVALKWTDLDLKADVPTVTVPRRLTKDMKIEAATKNGKPRRVPLRPKVLEALLHVPRRLEAGLLFPAARGGLIDLHNWREDYWHPAMVSAGFVTEAGKPSHTPYALRHTYATWALRAGIPTFTVARRMGTSVQMIEKTYGHLAHDAEEWELERLIAFDDDVAGRKVDAPWLRR
jgi:integrase